MDKITFDKITENQTDGKQWSKIVECKSLRLILFVNVDILTNAVHYSVMKSITEYPFDTIQEAIDCYNSYL